MEIHHTICRIPIGGYTKLVEKPLEGVEVQLNTDYLLHRAELDEMTDKIVYTGSNDAKNNACYARYRDLADKENKVILGGRLGEYKYYDMDAVIEAALNLCAVELG